MARAIAGSLLRADAIMDWIEMSPYIASPWRAPPRALPAFDASPAARPRRTSPSGIPRALEIRGEAAAMAARAAADPTIASSMDLAIAPSALPRPPAPMW